ncbi:hypothetical protein B0A48_16310 [Cryoendolithus antarcticus]|uniref:Glucose-methanol-choline oxidoreductase N-terminal domain-containing protein n=1 Tax=Cryoendolithus antarcticus TaxID=1507870 RepID=A0A1V8SFU8_9PEZI|nr:hypothetical protein B0A48_16310 [Cryoendolithus antarcticus]
MAARTIWTIARILLAVYTLFFKLVWNLFRALRMSFLASQQHNRRPPRIGKPIHTIRDSYDVVVIGSGYGGGVAASRMARAQPKQSVCVLERGLERWPGEYPSSTFSVLRNLCTMGQIDFAWFKGIAIRLGNLIGLYRWICAGSSNAFVGNGLGGTSLINANVYLRPRSETLTSLAWPAELRQPGELDTYFERAERMLEPQSDPKSREPIRKYSVFKEQAHLAGLGDSFVPAKQTVAFEDRVNSAGVHLRASTLSGQDSTGLNDGSKNSVLATYLADAYCFGAEIYCGCDVQYIKKHPANGWLVYYRRTESEKSWPWSRRSPRSLRWVHAKQLVFLGAGSLGSTEIILRSKAQGLPVSTMVGKGLSGNGGFLGFGYDLNRRVDATGQQGPKHNPPGPTISSMIDCRTSENYEEDFIIQDGAFPRVMSGFFRLVKPFLRRAYPPRQSTLRKLRRFVDILNPMSSAMQRSQVYLVPSHDNATGSMTLQNDTAVLNVSNIGRKANLARIKTLLIKITHALDGVFMEQGFKVIVHLLGGLGMAGDGSGRTGSTTHTGELFTGAGSETHAGLYVVDGAVVPRSLCANPFATITALAERSVEAAALRLGCAIDLDSRADFERTLGRYCDVLPTELPFFETMTGDIYVSGTRSQVTLNASIVVQQSADVFEGTIYGTLECDGISQEQLVIKEGSFRPFVVDSLGPDQMVMAYDFTALDGNGNAYEFRCRKVFNPSVGVSVRKLWHASTTMTVDITSLKGGLYARGELHIDLPGVLDMVSSMSATGRSHAERWWMMMKFLSLFVRKLSLAFFPRLAPLRYPLEPQCNGAPSTEHRSDGDAVHTITASDGVTSTLRMWNRTSNAPTNSLQDIIFIPGSAVNHLIFASPYMTENAISYFTSKGYRCWCLTTRFGRDEGNATKFECTSYSARLDIAAALIEHRRLAGPTAPRPYVVAHCVGSLALASGLLDGTIPASWLAGVTASATFFTPCLGSLSTWKARLPLISLYRLITGEDWYACESPADARWIQRLLDNVLRFYPHASPREVCSSNVCHRCNLAFGRLWNHANLNEATHSHLEEIFGGIHTTCLQLLADMGRKQVVTDDRGNSLVTKKNVARLAGLPVLLLSGSENVVYPPVTTKKTWEMLMERFGDEMVRRRVIEGVGHLDLWISDKAAEKGGAFGVVLEEIRRVTERSEQ